jgi:hypothetical protein
MSAATSASEVKQKTFARSKRRDPFDPKTRRVMHRSQIKGDERIV